jgi:hypothetical protein
VAVLVDPQPTYNTIMGRTGLTSRSTVHQHLQRLRRCGLVDWADRTAGTIHPTCAIPPEWNIPTCRTCGAVYYGNAGCADCHSRWPWHDLCPICDGQAS